MTTFRGPRRPSVVPITAPSFTTPQRPYVYRKIAYTFIAFTVCLVIAVLWLSSVRAQVVVQAKYNEIRVDEKLAFAKAPEAGQVLARVVQGSDSMMQEFSTEEATSSEVTSTHADAATSTEPAVQSNGDDNVLARGTVTIVNTYSRSQTLVRTTRLLTTDGKLYHIDARVVVPSNGRVDVAVYADEPGSAFVIGPAKFTIPGLWPNLQKFIYAESKDAFTGEPVGSTPKPKAPVTKSKTKSVTPAPASTGPKRVVTLEAITAAQASVQDALMEKLKKTLATSVQDATFTDVTYQINRVEKKSNVSPGQSTDKFLVSVRMDVTAVYYVKEDVMTMIRTNMKQRVPDGRELLPPDPAAVALEVTDADAKAELAHVNVQATSSYRITPSSPLLQKSLLAGKSKDGALGILRAIDGVDKADITLHPSWISHIPSLQDHIDITIQ